MVVKMKYQTEWNFDALIKGSDNNFVQQRKLIEQKVNQFVKKWSENEDYLSKVKVLKTALDEYEELYRNYGTSGNEGYYYHLLLSLKQDDPTVKAKSNLINDFALKMVNKLQFFELKLARINEDRQKFFLNVEVLKPYKNFLKSLFRESKYLLGEEAEKVLNLKSASAYGNWVRMTSEFLSKEERSVLDEQGKSIKKNFSQILSLMNSQNKSVRDSAASAFNDILFTNLHVAEHELNSVLKDKMVNDQLRGMNRPDLGRHLSDDVDSSMVDVLVDSVSRRFDVSKRFYKLKAKLLGVKSLAYHERNVPYGKLSGKYDFEKGVLLIKRVFGDLDPEFRDFFESYLNNGQIDVFAKKGKQSGAFCAHNLIVQPTYILLNYNNQLVDVLTMAHELGHGINNELMKQKLNGLSFGLSMATAEVASTFMEDFVLSELAKEADDELKLSLLMSKLNDDVSTIFRQVACYKFELDLHSEFRKVGYLSSVDIGNLFVDQMQSYMGEAVEQSKGSENWWVYWSHIRQYFYVYSYASGLLISKYMQKRVREDRSFIVKVKEFLSTGRSLSPKESFLKMGVDIGKRNFWDEGVSAVESLLTDAENLASRLGKL